MGALISIIVPIYNVDKYLERCIESILKQTYRVFELILVDDGSTDHSLDICKKFLKKDSRIKIIHKENEGLVSARKAGIKIASGDYIGYVDGDDWIEPDMYMHLINCMIKTGADMIESDYFIDIDDKKQRMESKLDYGSYNLDEIVPIMLCDNKFNEYCLKPCLVTKLFKREILRDVQLSVNERISFGEDAAVLYPYVLKCKKIIIENYASYHYVQRKGSLSNKLHDDELDRDRELIKFLNFIFEKSKYIGVLHKELNQFTKILLLLRQISYFDKGEESMVLLPFGGIDTNSRVVIYGAGKLGQELYRYLSSVSGIKIVAWLDIEFKGYRSLGLCVQDPDVFLSKRSNLDIFDRVIIAINRRNLANSINQYLINAGVDERKIVWRLEEFENENFEILQPFIENQSIFFRDKINKDLSIDRKQRVGICGFRVCGRQLYQEMLQMGIEVPFIIERNYQSLSVLETAVPPIVGFDEKGLYKMADLIVVSEDMDFEYIKENIELADIKVPLISQKDFKQYRIKNARGTE